MKKENEQCIGCEHLSSSQYSTDGFDVCFDEKCKKAKKTIDGCRDWHEKLPVPNWCPLLVKTPPITVNAGDGNYKIIQDEGAFLHFIDWLPELEDDEMFYGCLFARKKYDTTGLLNSYKSQLKRFTSKKEYIYQKVKQMECAVGSYTFNGQPIPQETLALYIMPNPRSLSKATRYSLIDFANMIADVNNKYKNPYKVALTNIQKYASRKVYLDFDFDFDFETGELAGILNKIQKAFPLNEEAYTILHTRGGFHLLVKISQIIKANEKTWYKEISSISQCDIRGDNLIPVPGCCQGGFVPVLEERW